MPLRLHSALFGIRRGKTVDENYPRVAAALNILARKAGIYGMIGGQNADIEAEEQTTP